MRSMRFALVGNNHLTGAIPNALRGCANMEYLLLDDNLFEGTVPDLGAKHCMGYAVAPTPTEPRNLEFPKVHFSSPQNAILGPPENWPPKQQQMSKKNIQVST